MTARFIVAYDGSTVAKNAIDEAGRLLGPARDAIVLTVWQPFDLGFIPSGEARLDEADSAQVRRAASGPPPTEPPSPRQRDDPCVAFAPVVGVRAVRR